MKIIAICWKCGREFLTLGTNNVSRDPYRPQGTLIKRLPITLICNGELKVLSDE